VLLLIDRLVGGVLRDVDVDSDAEIVRRGDGFHKRLIIHREEELLVQRPDYQELIAHALVKALVEVFPAGKREKKGLMKLLGR
jgi:hypothetical protein